MPGWPALPSSQARLLREIVTVGYSLGCIFPQKILIPPADPVDSAPPYLLHPIFQYFSKGSSCVALRR